MRVLTVNGKPLTDMIVWLWETEDVEAEIEVFDPRDNTVASAVIERFPGEEWASISTASSSTGCAPAVNACIFCFMNMLPKESRSTLTIRDDDYRLSFCRAIS